jgi:hypothetical protein
MMHTQQKVAVQAEESREISAFESVDYAEAQGCDNVATKRMLRMTGISCPSCL